MGLFFQASAGPPSRGNHRFVTPNLWFHWDYELIGPNHPEQEKRKKERFLQPGW